MVVNEKIVESTVKEYLPFIATENIMMESVKRGGDRQQLHEIIRQCSMEATANMKNGGRCNLPEILATHPEFSMTKEEIEAVLDPKLYTGRCAEQVERYVEKVKPLLDGLTDEEAQISV